MSKQRNEDDSMRIPLTFKKHEKPLYDYCTIGHTSPAAFIKDLILKDMKESEKKESLADQNNSQSFQPLDF